MRFQEYCDQIKDGQSVKAEKTLLVTYTNSKGEVFSISPESIRLFLLFLLDNYSDVHRAWSAMPSKKDFIYQYEEKSYRAIYKSAKSDELKVISSAGSSQTKALTTLIAKLIGFLTGTQYQKPEINTFFEERSLRLALEKWGDFVGGQSLNKEKLPSLDERSSISYIRLSKPFLLLAGISGTGKTRFVRDQAKASNHFSETYCLTSVRPDWHEPSDLLGYISRLSGAAEYITTVVLQFIAKSWRAIADSGLNIEVHDSGELGDRLIVSGESDALERVLPYWLCLDEMNLAPVEQYFADYLSVLETREWCWAGDSFTYSCDALLKPATIKEVADSNKLREVLGFESEKYDELWGLICQFGLGIPFNLMVAGTVNMDESTRGFSRKVIDRALSFDFGAFFPNDYGDFFTPTSCNKRLSYPIWSNASKADLANTFDVDGAKTVAFLSAVNEVLKNTPFELAFRALNELLLAVASSQPQDDLTLKAVWDDFMMCKVLPRIEGDTNKLTTSDGKALLAKLNTVLADQFSPIWLVSETDEDNQRPDLYREKIVADGATEEEKVLRIPCRSKAKLQWMSERLASATFTSFWP